MKQGEIELLEETTDPSEGDEQSPVAEGSSSPERGLANFRSLHPNLAIKISQRRNSLELSKDGESGNESDSDIVMPLQRRNSLKSPKALLAIRQQLAGSSMRNVRGLRKKSGFYAEQSKNEGHQDPKEPEKEEKSVISALLKKREQQVVKKAEKVFVEPKLDENDLPTLHIPSKKGSKRNSGIAISSDLPEEKERNEEVKDKTKEEKDQWNERLEKTCTELRNLVDNKILVHKR